MAPAQLLSPLITFTVITLVSIQTREADQGLESAATIFCVCATHELLLQPDYSDWSTGTHVSQLSQSQTADSSGRCNSTYVAQTTNIVSPVNVIVYVLALRFAV